MALRILIVNPSGEEPRGVLQEVFDEWGAIVDELTTQEAVDLLSDPPSESARVVPSLPPNGRNHDCLIVLGSPLGVLTCPPQGTADQQTPYALIRQIELLLHDFHQASKPVLGLCLGAQCIARAFGGLVLKLPRDAAHTALPSSREQAAGMEFGFHQQDFNEAAERDPVIGKALDACRSCELAAGASAASPAFMQWHSDTYTYPPGSVPLSSRSTCANQAFRLGQRTYAFQYHIEVGRELGKEWYKEYMDGTASHCSSGAEEALTNESDRVASEQQLQKVITDGSVERAEHFTRSVMRSLMMEATEARRELRTRQHLKAAGLALAVAVTIAFATKLATRYKK